MTHHTLDDFFCKIFLNGIHRGPRLFSDYPLNED